MDAFSFMDQAHDHLTGFLLSVDYEIPGVFQGMTKMSRTLKWEISHQFSLQLVTQKVKVYEEKHFHNFLIHFAIHF